MNQPAQPPLVAVDIGNTRIKLGLFARAAAWPPGNLPEPLDELSLSSGPDADWQAVSAWLRPFVAGQCSWWIGSVNRPAATRLIDWLRDQQATRRITLLCAADLPLTVRVPRPDMVGVDRLLAAVAANHLRSAGQAAVVVSLGSAITVNSIDAAGAFTGGAILPGIGMSARAMHDYTDLLPLLEYAELAEAPAPAGDDTRSAMRAGLFWGAVGAVRELAARQAPQGGALVLVTGGAAESVVGLMGERARLVPHLVLSGIALVALSSGALNRDDP